MADRAKCKVKVNIPALDCTSLCIGDHKQKTDPLSCSATAGTKHTFLQRKVEIYIVVFRPYDIRIMKNNTLKG